MHTHTHTHKHTQTQTRTHIHTHKHTHTATNIRETKDLNTSTNYPAGLLQMERLKGIFSNRMKRQTAVCCMWNWRQTDSQEMQFYASFAHNLEFDEPRHPSTVSKPTLDIKSSAFFSPAEEEEERCGKKKGSVIDRFTSPTVLTLPSEAAAGNWAEQMQTWAVRDTTHRLLKPTWTTCEMWM